MFYMLDKNIIIDLFDGKANVLKKFKQVFPNNQVSVPCISYYEVLRGFRYRDPKGLISDLDIFCKRCGITYLSHDAIQIAADLYADLKKGGCLIEDDDILIGAIAIANNATLITNNTKHLSRLKGILLEEWN